MKPFFRPWEMRQHLYYIQFPFSLTVTSFHKKHYTDYRICVIFFVRKKNFKQYSKSLLTSFFSYTSCCFANYSNKTNPSFGFFFSFFFAMMIFKGSTDPELCTEKNWLELSSSQITYFLKNESIWDINTLQISNTVAKGHVLLGVIALITLYTAAKATISLYHRWFCIFQLAASSDDYYNMPINTPTLANKRRK